MTLRIAETLAPLRDMADIEALERTPLDERLWSTDVNDWIRRGCESDPDKIAIHDVEGGDPDGACVSWTYRELLQRSRRCANLLHALGVGPQDVVLYLLPTSRQHYAVMLGALAAGVACCVNWMLKGPHLLELVRSSKAKVIVALGPTPGFDIWEKIDALRADIPPSVHVFALEQFDALASQQPGDRLLFERHAAPRDLAALVHSGGTTGSPKLVKLTHHGFSYKCWANAVVVACSPDDVIFADYPMFHIAGFFGRGVHAVAMGMQIVIPTPLGARDKRFLSNYWRFVDRFRITLLSGVPTTLSVLAKTPPRAEDDVSSLRPYMCTGSTALPVDVAHAIERSTGVRVLLTYGATEYTQNVTQGPRDGDPRHGSAGLRLPYAKVRIAKLLPDGSVERDCAPGEIGVVLVGGPSVTPGYLDPVYDDGVFTPDGWFNSGDLGRVDADGYLWLTGRAKDVIIRGGHNIDPSIIEETLRAHAAVLLVAAVGKPDAHAGEVPVAYVQLADGATASADELVAFARDNITEAAAAPKEVLLVSPMPLTDVGKPNKPALRFDAARRAFTAVLAPVLDADTTLSVDVGPDASRGTLVTVALSRSRQEQQRQQIRQPQQQPSRSDTEAEAEAEAAIADVMKAYAVHHVVQWL